MTGAQGPDGLTPTAPPRRWAARLRRWWSLAVPKPNMDRRYRVLQRRHVREAVRIQIVLVMAIVIGDFVFIGLRHPIAETASVATLVVSAVLLWNRRLVHSRPYGTAIFAGVILNLLIATALIDGPDDATLFIGSYAIVIVASALFCAFDQRPHMIWLAFSFGLWLIALQLASIDAPTRVQAEVVALSAVVASAAGNRLVQARRERAYATELTLREQRRDLRVAVARLQAALKTIANLEGVLPICAHCKRIREGEDTWVRIETYVEKRSSAQFSHGICPECAERYFPGVLAEP